MSVRGVYLVLKVLVSALILKTIWSRIMHEKKSMDNKVQMSIIGFIKDTMHYLCPYLLSPLVIVRFSYSPQTGL